MKPGALEAILAAYLTDGHHNGIAIGVRNIDPMVFKHLADLGLIKTVFIVRGTGDTWGFGSYFPKKLSDAALKCLEGPEKPFTKIKEDILRNMDIVTFFKWIVEYEANMFIGRWKKRLLLVVCLTQYETLPKQINTNVVERLRLSVRDTNELISTGLVTPTRLWLDDVIEEFMRRSHVPSVRYYKYYQMDATGETTSLVHTYHIYADVTSNVSAVELARLSTLKGTWKSITAEVISEAIHAYHDGHIDMKDIDLIKKVLNCNIGRPLKGPYNEYVVAQISKIYPLLLKGTERQVEKRLMKLKELLRYFSAERKKSFERLLRSMTMEDIKRLRHLTQILSSLNSLVEMLQAGGTPIGRVGFIKVVSA